MYQFLVFVNLSFSIIYINICFFFRCSCEYFFPPSLRSSYYGNYLYRPRRYYYGHSRGYGSRWGRPGRDRLSSGLIKRAETYDGNLISSLKYDDNDDSNERLIDKYNDDELKFIIQHILKASNDVDKRGFDRLTSGFIRRKRSPDADNENVKIKQRRKRSIDDIETEPKEAQSENAIQNDEDNVKGVEEAKRTDETFFAIQRNKKGFNRLTSSFVKKSDLKDSIDSLDDAVSGNENHVDKETASEAENLNTKGSVSAEESAEIKTKLESSELDPDADGHDNIKRHFDRLASSFVKRRGFDRLTSGFVKRRGFDRLTSGFVKRRGFDRLTSGFVKKDDDKRRVDRLMSGFVKKDDEKRRGFDRLTSGFVKKDSDLDFIDNGETAEKRRFDRLTSGFVKKDNNKRYIDRMASGFVKKDNDKRGFDRLTSGFVKKDDDKRRFDRLTSGFVKKDADKRYFGRLNAGFVKKDADKRYFGRLNSGFVKKDKDDKRGFDRLTSGFVKKSNKINDMGNANKGSFTYDLEGLGNDIMKVGNYYNVIKGDNSENGEKSDEIPNSGIWLPTDDSSNDQN